MKPLKLKYGAPVVVRRCDWQEMEDGSFRCGNVLIRCDERTPSGGYVFQKWNIYRVEENGTLTRIHPKSRPWAYGHAGQAKIGAAKMMEPVDGDPAA